MTASPVSRWLDHRPPLLLELDLTELPVDPDPHDPLARLRARGRRQLRPSIRALHDAGADPRVRGLIVKLGRALPWSAMQELMGGVRAFASSGKPTVGWAETFGEESGGMAAYVLATAFDEIWLQPGGGVGMLGVGIEATFVRGVLDKVGIEPQLEQRYEYKNAADRVMLTDFTEPHRESLERLSGSIFDDAVTAIADGRVRRVDEIRTLVDTGPRTASQALEAGLVDHLGYRDQVYAHLRQRIGDDTELLFADRWQPSRRPSWPVRGRGHVALVEIRGGIASGRSQRGPMGRNVGSDSVSAELRAAADDDRCHSVVLRVDSPGGSAVASETIWREVTRLKEAGKPVVVSMGQAAASGGYFVACPADVIVALPATLTGSIGVFGGKFVVAELMSRVGLTSGSIEQGSRSLMYSTRRGFTDEERVRLNDGIDAIYTDFVAKVAAGRGRPVSEIETLARGRVWTGADAYERGLVDELGGLRDAVRIARKAGGLRDDAAVRPAGHVPRLARLGRPKNSEDPRAMVTSSSMWSVAADLAVSAVSARGALLGDWSELVHRLGLNPDAELRMPEFRLR